MPLRTQPARDPGPAAAPAGLLHPADPHHRTGRRGEDPAETRLSLSSAPPLLRPPHQRRTSLLHHQGPGHQHHQPRLVPPHGPATTRALARCPARRPQPAHPHHLERPPGREHPPGRGRPPAQNTQTPPENHPRQPRHTTLTRPAHHATRPRSPARHQPRTPRPRAKPGQHTPAAAIHQEDEDRLRPRGQATEMSDPNVNMVPTET